jgi:DNA-binding NarL/FixJ family response regulator
MIRIAIVDDQSLFARGLKGFLEEQKDFKILGIFQNGNDLIKFLENNQVDLVLTELNLPEVDGFWVLNSCKINYPELKVVVLTIYNDEKIYKNCIQKGADGYILKNGDPDQLVFMIKEIFEGRSIPSFSALKKPSQQHPLFDSFKIKFHLSRREMEILQLITEGNLNKFIASHLNLSIKTVETHRKNIYSKLQVSNRIELVNKASRINN